MRNRYGGTCYRCGEWVDPGAGHFERCSNGWRVQHADCAITYRGTDQERDRTPEQIREARRRWLIERAKLTGPKGQRARRELRKQGEAP